MKNNILIIGCIISCFILASLTYQPIIAKEQKSNSELYLISYNSYIDIEIDTTPLNKLLKQGESVITIIDAAYWTSIPEFFYRLKPFWIRNLFFFGSINKPMQTIHFEIYNATEWATISFSTSDILVQIPYGDDKIEMENLLDITIHNDAPSESHTFKIRCSCDNIYRLNGFQFDMYVSFTTGG